MKQQAMANETAATSSVEEDRSSGTTMELRRVRKLTDKKRQLDIEEAEKTNSIEPVAKRKRGTKNGEDAQSHVDDDDDDEDEALGEEEAEISDVEEEEDKAAAAAESGGGTKTIDVSESSALTLEQFSEIVLASEGLSVDKNKKVKKEEVKEDPPGGPQGKPVLLEEVTVKKENNNNTEELVTNLMQNNNDLIVEVKPMRPPKPVVLSPRQPPGMMHHRNRNHQHPSLSSSVVVSVKPRVQTSTVSSPLPPQNKPPNIPRLVEEWFSKMQPPISGQKGQQRNKTSASIPPATVRKPRSASVEALNLCTKPATSKTTQVYLRPIPTPPKLMQTSSSASRNTVPALSQDSHARLSPPRLEITKSVRPSTTGSPLKRVVVGRAAPFEANNTVHFEAVRARALRDVQIAHTKDMHGNLPIHMSVLMRKPELVRRYCCILQVLESSIDLINEDKMTPLHLAIRDNSLEIIEILLAFGANPAVKDRRGNTSLHMATAAKSTDILSMLVKNVEARDVNSLNEYGLTPLHIATMNNDLASAEILTKHGGDPTIPDGLQGLTPLAMAKQGKIMDPNKKAQVEIPSR